ncbi:MAG: hypothetical protein JW810_12435 [Sedimentisphaerales bacterium]|nr:hypothetical protein [Sedimentisphaerales bacterium]
MAWTMGFVHVADSRCKCNNSRSGVIDFQAERREKSFGQAGTFRSTRAKGSFDAPVGRFVLARNNAATGNPRVYKTRLPISGQGVLRRENTGVAHQEKGSKHL